MGSPSPQIGCRPVDEPCWIQRFLAASPTCHPGQASVRSEEHTSELQSLMRISYAVFCLKKKNKTNKKHQYLHCKTTQKQKQIQTTSYTLNWHTNHSYI